MSEEHLISQLKQGDQTAFRKLVSESGNKVYNTALGILQNAEDAEDISQEVFIEVFHSIDQFKGESKLSTWLYRITVTKSLEFIRKKKRQKRFAFFQNLFGTESILAIHDPGHFHHPGIQLENKERAAVLFRAIDKLQENQKTAFVLAKLEGLAYSEIAAIMKLSVSSVESLMFRARQNLQKLLADYYEVNEK